MLIILRIYIIKNQAGFVGERDFPIPKILY